MRKNRLCPLLIILLMLLLLPAGVLGEEMRGFVKGQGYQYVNLGEYPYEADGTVRPVLWRILSIDDGIALLHMENVIDVKQVIFETDPKVIEKHTFRRISSYAESDLFPWINSEMLDNLMGDNPLRGALVSDPELGTLRPLTRDECLDPAYGFSRNPMLLGVYLYDIGVLIWIQSWCAVLVFVAEVVLLTLQVRSEEKRLEADFGDEYRTYKANVRRYLNLW
ncbi:MAG: isoprenylcysteine carboxylmethyltransferase family protein [Lachnospiraceae bacterium]|nr:isoprenylcysteine carboxylmethyltransferase family protein [Lachnospiraceae bacterium]